MPSAHDCPCIGVRFLAHRGGQHAETWWPRLLRSHAPVAWDDTHKDYTDLPPQVRIGDPVLLWTTVIDCEALSTLRRSPAREMQHRMPSCSAPQHIPHRDSDHTSLQLSYESCGQHEWVDVLIPSLSPLLASRSWLSTGRKRRVTQLRGSWKPTSETSCSA